MDRRECPPAGRVPGSECTQLLGQTRAKGRAEIFFFSGKELLRKPGSMVPSSGAGLMQVKCCFSLILTNRQSRTNENRIYWKASTKSTQDQPRTLAFGILPLSDKEVIYLQQPVPLWSRAEPSLPYQAARWLWRRRTTNTLLPSAGHHRETLLDLRAKSLLSLTAWDFQLCIVWTLPTWDQQQKRKSKGLF